MQPTGVCHPLLKFPSHSPPQGVLRISSDGDNQMIFWGEGVEIFYVYFTILGGGNFNKKIFACVI